MGTLQILIEVIQMDQDDLDAAAWSEGYTVTVTQNVIDDDGDIIDNELLEATDINDRDDALVQAGHYRKQFEADADNIYVDTSAS